LKSLKSIISKSPICLTDLSLKSSLSDSTISTSQPIEHY